MKDIIELREKARLLGIAISGCKEKDFDSVTIESDGIIGVNFSEYYCGDTDSETVYLTEKDLLDPFDEVVKRSKEKLMAEILRKKEEEKKRRADYEKAKAESEYNNYLALRKKFEL